MGLNIKYTSLMLLLLVVFSCKKRELEVNGKKQSKNEIEKIIKKTLTSGFYYQNNDIGVAIYNNNIFYFSKNSEGFTNDSFMLHLIKENDKFENLDFSKDEYILNDSLKGVFQNISVIHRELKLDGLKAIRTGQYRRLNIDKTENIWSNNFYLEDIYNLKSRYKNELRSEIGINLIHERFESMLKVGVFFQNDFGFYILMIDDEIFLICKNSQDLKDKFMFHLIREDNTFKNLSFWFEEKEFQQNLDSPFNNFKIARILLPDYEFYESLRIGQYNDKGNIWAQGMSLDDLYSNKLLRYNNELEN